MKNIKYLPLLCFMISCTESQVNEGLEGFSIETLEIPVPEAFNPDRTRTQYIESDSGEYLAILNKTTFSINIFNLETKKSLIKIPLSKEGPNGLGVDNGFQIVSKDCLFMVSIPPKIHILNFEGQIKRSIPIEDKENEMNFLVANNAIPFLFYRNNIIGAQPFLRNFFQQTGKNAAQVKHIYQVNLFTQNPKPEWFPIYRPEDSWSEGRKDEDFSWTDRFDSIIVAPYTDHRLWVISKKEKSLLSHIKAKSNSVNNFQFLNEKGFNGDEGIIEKISTDRYEIILYDKYRDIFYRFFFIGVDWEDFAVSPRELLANTPKVGVLVLDAKLKVIGEHLFENHYVQIWNYFVGRKGLYVSTNNPNRDDFDENFLRYDILRFSGLTYED